jgi:hypothetical protein
MYFDTITFRLENQTYGNLCMAGRVLREAMGDLEQAREKEDSEEVSKHTRAVTDATEKLEVAFKNLDYEVHVVTAHGVIVFCALHKNRVDDFMSTVRGCMCCERAKTRFGVETHSGPAKNVQLTRQQILHIGGCSTDLDVCTEFIKSVKSVVVCECKTPYQRDADLPVNPFRRW